MTDLSNPTPPIDTSNDFFLGSNGDTVQFLTPPLVITPDQAIRTAAWLVALTEHSATHTFADVYEAVCNT